MTTTPHFRTVFIEGVAHFNARRFWEAHESWEELWREADGELRQFLQGLIQLAAAYHHIQRGTLRGAPRLIDAALRRLEPIPRRWCGIDRGAAVASARVHRDVVARGERIADGDYPTLPHDDV